MWTEDVLTRLKALYATCHELVVMANQYLATRFGTPFQAAIDWVVLGLLFVLVWRLVRFSFDVLRYVVVPSLLVSGVVSALSPLSFLYVMPFALGAGTVFLLFKN